MVLLLVCILIILYIRLSIHLKDLQREFTRLKSELIKPNSNTVSAIEPSPNQNARVAVPKALENIASAMPDKQKRAEVRFKTASHYRFERLFGDHLLLTLGAIAIILAGFFMVRYSIQIGLMTPSLRIVGASIFAGLFFAGGIYLSFKSSKAAKNIGVALAGAAIAIGYGNLFAATTLYQLLPASLAFVLMVSLTILAVVTALYLGPAIAALGLLGGVLTPLLASSHNLDVSLLFIYLYCLYVAALLLIRQRNWWGFILPLNAAMFIWAAVELFFTGPAYSGLPVQVFIVAIVITGALLLKFQVKQKDKERMLRPVLNYMHIGIGFIFLAGINYVTREQLLINWMLLSVLTIAAISLARIKAESYEQAPWLALIVIVCSLNTVVAPIQLSLLLLLFGLLFALSGYGFFWRTQCRFSWASLYAAASLIFYYIGWRSVNIGIAQYPAFWALLAIGLALPSLVAARILYQREACREDLVAFFLLNVFAFIALAFIALLNEANLILAFSIEALAAAWLSTKLTIKYVRILVTILAIVVFLLLLAPLSQFLNYVLLTLAPFFATHELLLQIESAPLFHMALPGGILVIAANILRKKQQDKISTGVEVFGCLLVIVGLYLVLMRVYFHFYSDLLAHFDFTQAMWTTNYLFLMACIFLLGAKRYERPMYQRWAQFLSISAVVRVLYFNLLVENPWFVHLYIAGMPVLNTLLGTFGATCIYLVFLRHYHWLGIYGQKALNVLLLVFGFITLNMLVREAFHPHYLDAGVTTNIEIYTYSLAWLILGMLLLILGSKRRSKMIRVGAFCILLLTVLKVFAYDTSNLSGLYRVGSFLVLGLCLLTASYCYSRFTGGQEQVARK